MRGLAAVKASIDSWVRALTGVVGVAVAPVVAAAVTLTVVTVPAGADIYTVDHSGGGDFLTIQEGIDAAGPGDTVLVADGTYTGAGNTNLDFNGTNMTVMSENGWISTRIDCQGIGPETRGFYFHNGEDTTSVVEGFSIVNGVAPHGGGIWCMGASPKVVDCFFFNGGVGYGGGISLVNSSAVIEGCVFDSNNVFVTGGAIYCDNSSPRIRFTDIISNSAGFQGGGMLCYNGGSPTLIDVAFDYNHTSGNGGGLYVESAPAALRDVFFTGNTADSGSGGGFYCKSPATLTFVGFSENSAAEDGGGMWCWGPSISLDNVSFVSDSSFWNGGGLYCEDAFPALRAVDFMDCIAVSGGGMYAYGGAPVLNDCYFSDNYADFWGGGMMCEDSQAEVDSTEFYGNDAGWSGGAIYAGFDLMPTITEGRFINNYAGSNGGAIAYDGGSAQLENALFTANTSDYGAAIHCSYGSTADISLVTVSDNATTTGGYAIECDDSSPVMANTIVSFTTTGGGIGCNGTSNPEILHSCIFGNASGDSLCGDYHDNIFVDPLYCDRPTEDYTVHDDSECLASNSPWGEQVGYYGTGGCGPSVGIVDPTPGPTATMPIVFAPSPNPFNQRTTIEYFIPSGLAETTIGIYNVKGELVRRIAAPGHASGQGEFVWDGRDESGRCVASGLYFCKAVLGDKLVSRKAVMIR